MRDPRAPEAKLNVAEEANDMAYRLFRFDVAFELLGCLSALWILNGYDGDWAKFFEFGEFFGFFIGGEKHFFQAHHHILARFFGG